MQKEERQLLLKDLSARLPYNPMVLIHDLDTIDSENYLYADYLDKMMSYSIRLKPFLRPMSSMTEEEAKEISILYGLKDILSIKIKDEYIEVVVDDGVCSTEIRTIWYDEIMSSIEIFDFLNAHHLDYRGLIPMGLAFEAPKGMYNFN